MLHLNVLIVSGSHIVRLGLSQALREISSHARIKMAADWDSAMIVQEYKQCSIIFIDEIITNNLHPNKIKIKDNQKLVTIQYSKDTVSTDSSISLFVSPQELADKLSSLILKESMEDETQLKNISKREIEIVRLISLGLSNREIAEKLNLSLHTISTHRKNIIRKLKIKTTSGLTVYAILNGIITIAEARL
ncbi:MAG: response regulator transcription factor [Lentimicrobium sp.]|nr:response regulator transcription factor [Lentimicrobium sp.]